MKSPEYKYAFFDLSSTPDSDSMDTYEMFKDIIQGTGCSLNIYTAKDGHQVLSFIINCETAKNSRHAGRKQKAVSREHWLITCGEVRAMVAENGAEAAAAELGISRATLYRRLKNKDDTKRF